MGDKIIKKYIPSTALAIILGISNMQTINVFANENDINNIDDNKITQINLLNVGEVDNLNNYINNLNNNEEILEDNQAIDNNKVFTSNIKNTYNLINSNTFIENEELDIADSIDTEYKDVYENKILNEIPMLAANVVSNENNNLIYEPYTIKDFEGSTVGIIGVVSKNNAVNLVNDFVITDELEAINKCTKELLEKGIENIIVVTDMELSTDIEDNTYNIFEEVDNQVDIIISENELNMENKYEDIKTQDKEFLFVQTDNNTIADINLSINKENNTIENKVVSFINNEDVVQKEDESTNNDKEDDNNNNENENGDTEQSIQPYIVGGTENSNNNNPPSNNSNQNNDDDNEDDNKDKVEDEEDEDNEDDVDDNEDEDNEDNEEKDDDEEEEEEDDNKDSNSDNKEDGDKKSTTINPKTGDKSIFMYVLGSVGAILGLSINKTKKEK